MKPDFLIGIPVYPGVDLLDVAGAREVFYWMGEQSTDRRFRTLVLAETTDRVQTHAGLPIVPDMSFDEFGEQELQLDLIWVPGASDATLAPMLGGTPFRARIQTLASGASYVTSVCTGAMLLADAGLLTGFRATSHWSVLNCLPPYGVEVAEGHPRYVVDRKEGEAVRVTGGGVSSGIDEALEIVQMLCGTDAAEQVQVSIQYFPHPPVQGTIPESPPCDLPAP